MYKDERIKNALVFIVIILFIGTSIVPGITSDVANSSDGFHRYSKENEKYIDIKDIGNQISHLDNPPGMDWYKSFGGTESDAGRSVQQTSDGGYIITGYTGSYGAGQEDVWLIKTDINGNLEWDNTFGGSDNEEGCSVQQTNDGGYIVIGGTRSHSAGGLDIWLIKTDSYGHEEWNRTFGGNDNDYGSCGQQTTDGGYIITGYTESYGNGGKDVWLIKTYSNGDVNWDCTFGGSGSDYGSSVQQTNDGGYIITGYTDSYGAGNWDVWLIKIYPNGYVDWDCTFGESGSDYGSSVQQTNDGGYIITGYTDSYGAGNWDVWLIKTYSNGYVDWDCTFGGQNDDAGYSVRQTNDGGYILISSTCSYGAGNWDGWLIKTDSNGYKRWDRTFGWRNLDIGCSVQQTSDDGYIITGETESYGAGGRNVWLIKVLPEGNHPPETPSISGPTSGVTNTTYTFYVSATDPDGDTVRYLWDWDGDMNVDQETSWYPSEELVSASHSWSIPDKYYIGVKAEDVNGGQSEFSSLRVDISSNPPYTPAKPSGPNSGHTWITYIFYTSTTDPDDDNVNYGWDWGDGSPIEWTDFYSSGVTVDITHFWETGGTYNVKVKAKDIHGAESGFFSPWLTVVISNDVNDPPVKPSRPSGTTIGRIGVYYTYSSYTTDPNGDQIYYLFDWGDDTDSGWIGPYNSGQSVDMAHKWNSKGNFPVKVKAKDIHGDESVWSVPLSVSMPKLKLVNLFQFNSLQKLIEDSPLLKWFLWFSSFEKTALSQVIK